MIQTYSALLDQNNQVINISIGFQRNSEDFCPESLVGTDCVLLVMIDGEIIFNNMPNIGDFFDEEINAFVPEKPDESYSLNENYEWMGHNSTNFPLGFLNHAAFNHYDLRRDWLPFKMILSKQITDETKYLEIRYLGDLNLILDPLDEIIVLEPSYEKVNIEIIEIPNFTNEVTLIYTFKNLTTSLEAQTIAFNYKNTRPLKAQDNLRRPKGLKSKNF